MVAAELPEVLRARLEKGFEADPGLAASGDAGQWRLQADGRWLHIVDQANRHAWGDGQPAAAAATRDGMPPYPAGQHAFEQLLRDHGPQPACATRNSNSRYQPRCFA